MSAQIQQREEDNIGLQEMRFITKVTTQGKDRIIIVVPRERFDEAKTLKGKHVRVILQELSLDDERE